MERMTKLRVGIAGYGIVGKRRRVCVDQNSDMQLVAVCDRSFPDDGVFSDGTEGRNCSAVIFFKSTRKVAATRSLE